MGVLQPSDWPIVGRKGANPKLKAFQLVHSAVVVILWWFELDWFEPVSESLNIRFLPEYVFTESLHDDLFGFQILDLSLQHSL